MKAITVEPMKPGSARYEDFPEPDESEGSILVEAVAVGVCGTDVDIVSGNYGWAPPGKSRLVLGHESLGRVIDPGPRSSFKKGDLVVGIVRRPDPVPCANCAVGEWDMCTNGQYTERGIKEIHGFMSERWRIEPEYAIKVDSSLGILGVLLEPMTVITKALEQVLKAGITWMSTCSIAPTPDQSRTLCTTWVRRIIPGAPWIWISIPTSSSSALVWDR
jgi:threonine dehydrogenase-like Zn-dependent dehydrogenase